AARSTASAWARALAGRSPGTQRGWATAIDSVTAAIIPVPPGPVSAAGHIGTVAGPAGTFAPARSVPPPGHWWVTRPTTDREEARRGTPPGGPGRAAGADPLAAPGGAGGLGRVPGPPPGRDGRRRGADPPEGGGRAGDRRRQAVRRLHRLPRQGRGPGGRDAAGGGRAAGGGAAHGRWYRERLRAPGLGGVPRVPRRRGPGGRERVTASGAGSGGRGPVPGHPPGRRRTLKVRDVMTTAVVTVGPEATFAEVVDTLLDNDVGGVPVVDGAGRLLGMVTEADLVAKEAYGDRPRR